VVAGLEGLDDADEVQVSTCAAIQRRRYDILAEDGDQQSDLDGGGTRTELSAGLIRSPSSRASAR
jgi:hypothetical protein